MKYTVLEVEYPTLQNQQEFNYYLVNSKPKSLEDAETFKRSLETAHKNKSYVIMTVDEALEQKVLIGRHYLSNSLPTNKKYNIQQNVGKIKFLVSFHDGNKKHSDGSDFFDVAIFSSKRKCDTFIKELQAKEFYQV